MLAGTAALPALAATPAIADISALAPDPIYAAIEAHRRAMAASHAAVAVSAALPDDTPEHAAAQAVTDRADAESDDAGVNLAAIEPTSKAGLFDVLGYVIGCIEQAADDDGLNGDQFDGGNWRLPHRVVGDDGTEQHFALWRKNEVIKSAALESWKNCGWSVRPESA
jgi:hypothetical protein